MRSRGSGTGVLREPSLGAPEPPTQSSGRVASLMNSLLSRRSSLRRHAPCDAALRAQRVPHRLGSMTRHRFRETPALKMRINGIQARKATSNHMTRNDKDSSTTVFCETLVSVNPKVSECQDEFPKSSSVLLWFPPIPLFHTTQPPPQQASPKRYLYFALCGV